MTHKARLLGKYDVAYFLCPRCDLLQTETPYWLEEAYRQSISTLDTGLIHRNIMTSRRVARFCILNGLEKVSGLDFAGGYGILVRMLRDLGLDFFWSDKYSPNLAAMGFAAAPGRKYAIVTAFEVFEHFNEPEGQIGEILASSPDFLLMETTLRESRSVPGLEWKYYAQQSGQHVAFYSQATCEFIAEKFGYHFRREGRLLVFSKRPRKGGWARWLRIPRAFFRIHFPDSIPFIRRDQESAERTLALQSAAETAKEEKSLK